MGGLIILKYKTVILFKCVFSFLFLFLCFFLGVTVFPCKWNTFPCFEFPTLTVLLVYILAHESYMSVSCCILYSGGKLDVSQLEKLLFHYSAKVSWIKSMLLNLLKNINIEFCICWNNYGLKKTLPGAELKNLQKYRSGADLNCRPNLKFHF